MKAITYCVYREGEDFVAQCLNVDVSSFGSSREGAISALKEALELYFEDAPGDDFNSVSDAHVGQEFIHA